MNILAIDIGGTGLKAAVVDGAGNIVSQSLRVGTPRPSPPAAVVDALASLVAPLTDYEAISVGFPGVVREGRIITAPNLDTEAWRGFDLAGAMTSRLGKPARVLNDADMQGFGPIEGKGVEMVITLGTGFGSALFMDGQLAPHLELGQHVFRSDETYDEQLGDATLKRIGQEEWNQRVRHAIDALRVLTNFDRLYIGGGNATRINFEPEPDTRLISNEDGLRGGARLWHQRADIA